MTPEDFEIPFEPFTFNGKTIELRGLSLPHIIHIVRAHKDALEMLYAKAITGQLEANAEAIAFELAEEFSPVIGRVIACGMGRPDLSEKMGNLPFGAQVEALEIIARLTLSQEGGLEKIIEIVTQALVRMNTVKQLPQKA